jgi:hypothetical protein
MSGETTVVFGTTKTLEANGATIANNALVQADDATYDIVADGGSYPDAQFTMTATFSVAPTEGTVLALYARPIDIDGTLDTDIPEVTRPTRYIGAFVVNNVTTIQPLELVAYDVPIKAEYYVHNVGTGQSVSTGWTLKVKPRTYKPAP